MFKKRLTGEGVECGIRVAVSSFDTHSRSSDMRESVRIEERNFWKRKGREVTETVMRADMSPDPFKESHSSNSGKGRVRQIGSSSVAVEWRQDIGWNFETSENLLKMGSYFVYCGHCSRIRWALAVENRRNYWRWYGWLKLAKKRGEDGRKWRGGEQTNARYRLASQNGHQKDSAIIQHA